MPRALTPLSAPVLASLLLLSGCAPDAESEAGGADGAADGSDGGDGADGADGADGDDGTDSAALDGCIETSASALPDGISWEEVTWLELDGGSDALLDFSQPLLSSEWVGPSSTWDLNAVEMESANGFRLERPGRVVAARAQWTGLGDEPTPARLRVWPDFGSNGYMWDTDHPAATVVRCLTDSDDGEWVDHVLEAAIAVPQPLHVFAGWRRLEGHSEAALYAEDTFSDAEPYVAGAWFKGVEDSTYYLGLATPWYVSRVRLGVVYDAPIADEDRPFQVDPRLTVGRRVAWGDYDGDGDDDLMSSGPTLHRNDGGGHFTDVTASALGATASAGGGVWGDYDNDGCLDYFGLGTSYTRGDLLLHNNCDGTLSDVTAAAGIDDLQSERDCDGDGLPENAPTEGAAWFDLDQDGRLDLYQANYECSSEHDSYRNYDDRVWRNNGDGTFSDWTLAAGIPDDNQAGRGVTTGDPDQDGDTDLYVSNYRLDRNFYLDNAGGGSLADAADANGTRGDMVRGAYGHTIGAAFGDIDGDADFDLVAANLAHPFYYGFSDRTNVFIRGADGRYQDERDDRGIYYRETHSSPVLFDADNDGDLDLFITAVYAHRDSDFYRNDGAGYFTLDNHASGLVRQNGWGAAAADIDQDGDLDLVADTLYRNDGEVGASLAVTAVGTAGAGGLSNRSAIGAVIEAHVGDRVLLRHVSGGSGTGVQDSLTQHLGAGAAERLDSVTVRFPGGASVTVEAVEVAAGRLWVREDGAVATGWAPPDW